MDPTAGPTGHDCMKKSRLVLPLANLHFVGWVEPILGYVGFRFAQPNLHFVSSIAPCETQQWPILEPNPKNSMLFKIRDTDYRGISGFF
jgi:hypothetical protein